MLTADSIPGLHIDRALAAIGRRRQVTLRVPYYLLAPHILEHSDHVATLSASGRYVTFLSSDGKLKFDGLENLAIERIARTIGDSPDQLEWSISGTITEYRGANYLP